MKKRTVLSLEQALSLSYGTLRFVQAGWRVIRLESTPVPGSTTPGDPNRYVGRLLAEPDRRSYFVAPNVGKESIALNLKSEDGRALLRRIVGEIPVDVFCCNTKPARYHELGIDFETMSGINTRIVWAGISAYGPESPDAPGYDPALQAKLGYMSLTGDPEGEPTLCGVPMIDLKSGDEVFAQVMMALLEQAEEGAGAKRIDVSMARAAVSWLQTTLPLVDMGATTAETTRSGNEHREFVPVNVYGASDGYVYVAVGNDVQWKRLVALDRFSSLCKPQWETNAGRRDGREDLHAAMRRTLATMKVTEVVSLLSQAGVVASEINGIEQLRDLPSIATALCEVEFPAGRKVSLPPSAIGSDGVPRRFAPPPRYGENTRSILEELGLGGDAIDDLERGGVIATGLPEYP